MTVEQAINELMKLDPNSILYCEQQNQDVSYGIAKMVSKIRYKSPDSKSNVIIEVFINTSLKY